jgi:hypothetical protein
MASLSHQHNNYFGGVMLAPKVYGVHAPYTDEAINHTSLMGRLPPKTKRVASPKKFEDIAVLDAEFPSLPKDQTR